MTGKIGAVKLGGSSDLFIVCIKVIYTLLTLISELLFYIKQNKDNSMSQHN